MLETTKKIILNILLAVGSGILMFLAFPRTSFFFLAWVALLPLFLFIRQEKTLPSMMYGFIAGLVGYGGIFYWIFPMVRFNTGSWIQAGVCMFLLASYMAAYVVLWVLGCSYIKKYYSKWVFFFFAAALWTVLEYVRTYLLTGFPWALLGYSQWNNLGLIQVSEFTGVYGVSFLLVLANAFLFFSIRARKILFLALFLVVPVIVSAAGLSVFKKTYEENEAIRVTVIQGNIDQYKKWNELYRDEIQDIYAALVRTVAGERPDVIIWPETSVPGYLVSDPRLLQWAVSLIKESRTYNIIGSPDEQGKNSFNATFAFGPDGDIHGVHRKNHLVPFGEFVPFRKYLEPFFGVLNTLGDFSKGHDTEPFRIKGVLFGTTICSENFFGSLVRKFVIRGAEVIVNQTNDAWFFRTAAAEQHFVMNVLRAIENRRPVIVCGNTGISGVISARGRVQKKTGLFTREYFTVDLKPSNVMTFYALYGDLFALACIVFCSLILIFSIKKMEHYVTR